MQIDIRTSYKTRQFPGDTPRPTIIIISLIEISITFVIIFITVNIIYGRLREG